MTAAAPSEARGSFTYQPALDGLRGMAVLAVVVYHHDAAAFSGGFLGVDVFFVLSGFLITTILLSRVHQGRSLGGFWSARLRRLLPPMLLALALVAAWAAWLAPPEALDRVRGDALASLGWVGNWRYVIEDRSYFAELVPSPLRHLWSLGVEMQWYIVWPVVVAVVTRLARQRAAVTVLAIAALLAVLSAAAMTWLYDTGSDPSRLYYGTDTHAAPLLVGAALAALLVTGGMPRGPVARTVVATAGLAGGATLALAMLRSHGTSPWLYEGGFLVVGLLTAAIVLAAVQPGPGGWRNPLRTALGFAPLRWLGLISYGVYLFHWPVYFIVTPDRVGADGWALLAVRLLVTLAVAMASYLLVELPIRRHQFLRPSRRVVAALAAMALVAAAVVAATDQPGDSWAARQDLAAADRPAPTHLPADPGDERRARVLLLGDSAAFTLGIGFENGVDERADLLVWNQGVLFCELLRYPRRHPSGEILDSTEPCADWPRLWDDLIEQFEPDVVALSVGPWEVFDRQVDGTWQPFGDQEMDSLLLDALDEAVEVLSSRGATVALLTAPPQHRGSELPGAVWTEAQRWRTEHLNALLAEVADRHPERAELVDLAGFVCPQGSCPSTLDGIELRSDGVHYTAEGAALVAEWLGPQLRPLAGRTGGVELDEAPVAAGHGAGAAARSAGS